MDYQNPDSAAVPKDLGTELRTRIAAGTVQARLHDLALLGDESAVAATGLRCVAAQGGPAWFVSDILSVSAQGAGAGIYTPENLLRFVAQLGLDVRAFDACLADASVAKAVTDETAAGKADGMTAGPVVVVSAGGVEKGRFKGPLEAAKVFAAIDAAARP
jgi:protein-disulfide isomerase